MASGRKNAWNGIEVSAQLESVLRQSIGGEVTIDWLLAHFISRTPEISLLLLAPLAIVPATSPFAGVMLVIIAMPLLFRGRYFSLPRFLAGRTISSAQLAKAFKVPLGILKWYEAYALSHPHPRAHHHARFVGFLVTILSIALLVPLPFSNVAPGFTIGIVSIASLEEDPRLLILASLLTAISLAVIVLEALSLFRLLFLQI